MKINTPVAVGILVVALLVIGLCVWKFTGVDRSQEGKPPPQMPPDIAQKMGQAMQNAPTSARALPARH